MDHIQKLLQQTGWSCEDLITKLNEFKQINELVTKEDVKTNGIGDKEESTDEIKEDFTKSTENSSGIEEIQPREDEEVEEKMDIDDDLPEILTENENKSKIDNELPKMCNENESKSEINNELLTKSYINNEIKEKNVFESEKDLENTIKKSFENQENDFHPKNIFTEHFDHTYTLNMKSQWGETEKNRKPKKSNRFRTISKSPRLNLLQKSRKFRKQLLKQKKMDRKLLIAQYKSPETVRSQIMEQLQLLRSRRSQLSVTVKPSKDKIVNKKRYAGEKWSTIINELMQLAEDQDVEIESNDILQNQCDIIIENDFETFDSNLINNHNLEKEKSITETLKNRIGNSLENLSTEAVPGTSSSVFKPKDKDEKMEINEIVDENEVKPSGLKDVVIVDVRGGCEIIPDNKSDEVVTVLDDEITEDETHMIKPTKTNDITKIKGWKNKRFSIANNNKFNSSNALPNISNNSYSSEAAFSSSNLDGFLEESDLHISFKIPTLESGVSAIKEVEKTKIPPPQTSPKEPDKDLLNLYHPRTLGQKKRIMTLKSDGKSKKNVQKPRTLAEKRRLMGNESLTKIYKEIKLNSADSDQFKSSYVLFRGKKLKVVTKTQNDVIAYIKSIYKPLCYTFAPKKHKMLKTKPSIFNNYSPTSTVLHYRPGPLCKKANLQYNNQNWKTTLKKLPKVKLMVIPQFKKPIDPYVEFLMPKYDFEITPDRLEFALTALESTEKEVTCFEFNVPFQNNQQEILLREKAECSSPILEEQENELKKQENIQKDDKKINEICKDVIDKMLNYLEIKEISDDVIKNDVNTIFLAEDKTIETKNDKQLRGKKYPKRNKTNNELRRLNVKVIEVNLEEKEEIKNCQKDFCRLGCVCRSLSTISSLVVTHCGRLECMFECNCNYASSSKGNVKVTFPTGVDLLSEGAVNRLENVAKRNLAKVEKEFTQTVIQANNQTIVVGGCSNRQRRATKLPKKYTDYVEHIDYFVRTSIANSENYDDLDLRNYQLKNSQVNLIKVNLDEIIPYCLTHQTYDCQCKCMDEYIPSEESDREVNSDEEEYRPDETIFNKILGISRKFQFPPVSDSCSRAKGIPTDYYLIRNRTKTFIKMRNRKFVRNMNRFWLQHDMDVDSEGTPLILAKSPEKSSASDEIVKVTSEKSRRKQELVVRDDGDITIIGPQNENARNPRKLRLIRPKGPSLLTPQKLVTKDFLNNQKVKQYTLKRQISSNSLINSEKLVEIKKFKEELQSSLESSTKQFEEDSKQIKQGIKLSTESLKNIEDDANLNKKDLNKIDDNIKQIKENSKQMKRFKMIIPLIRENVHYCHPSSDITDQFINMFGKKGDTIFILLQWKTLAYYYQLRKVNVWFSSYYNAPKIIITDLFIKPRHFTNVKHFERSHNKFLLKNEIIRALITGTIPGNDPNDDVQVILELTDMLCYVHGTFKKNHNNKEKDNSAQKRNSRKDKSISKVQPKSLILETKLNKSQDKVEKDTSQENVLSPPSILASILPSISSENSTGITPSISTSIPTSITPSTSIRPSILTSITQSVSTSITQSISTSTSAISTPISTRISAPIHLNISSSINKTESLLKNTETNELEPEKEKALPLFSYPTVRKIMFSKFKCQQYNYISLDKDNENIVPCTVQGRLPLIKNTSLWRMIKLNSDFSVLSLERSDYRIKYSDLQKVLKMADDKQMTIAIRTEQSSNITRSHKDFGIYASPIPSNSVFIGPYLQTENHDVILMRYLNRELITTEMFHRMKGNPRPTTGVWLQQKKDLGERNLHTIDLTESDHENKSDDNDEEDENKPILTTKDLEIFENEAANYYNFQNYIEIDVTKMSFQHMTVTHFFTNVKNLGYIVGNQHGKHALILRYPNSSKGLQFKTVANAIEFLEKELSSSFIEATGFKIKVTAGINITPSNNVMFDKTLLQGYYVVNEKGFINVLEITPAKLKELNMTETKLCKGVSLRAARMVYDRCLEASKHCGTPPFVHTRKSTVALLKWLTDEIEELKAESDRQNVQLTVFHQQKPMLVEHFKEIYLDLAPKADWKLKTKMEELLILNGISMDEKTPQNTSKQNEIICVDINQSSSSKIKIQETKLPIYTKNPDMIITATTTSKETKLSNNSEIKLPKVSVKDISTLQEKVEEKKVDVNKKDENKNDKSKNDKSNKVYKYLFKTTKGKLIEIAPEQYEILKANKLKSSARSNSQENIFQLGSLTITPKLSKSGLEPLLSDLPSAELKNIVIPENLPPGFVKLTLKNVLKSVETKSKDGNT